MGELFKEKKFLMQLWHVPHLSDEFRSYEWLRDLLEDERSDVGQY